jgi:hypothetical protein
MRQLRHYMHIEIDTAINNFLSEQSAKTPITPEQTKTFGLCISRCAEDVDSFFDRLINKSPKHHPIQNYTKVKDVYHQCMLVNCYMAYKTIMYTTRRFGFSQRQMDEMFVREYLEDESTTHNKYQLLQTRKFRKYGLEQHPAICHKIDLVYRTDKSTSLLPLIEINQFTSIWHIFPTDVIQLGLYELERQKMKRDSLDVFLDEDIVGLN